MSNHDLSPKQAKAALKKCMAVGLVPIIRSSPGIGKSSIAAQLAQEHNLELIDIRLPQMDLVDLNGFPNLDGKKAKYLPFDIFPVEGDELPEGKKGWLILFDEISAAHKDIQAASYKVILDRMVGTHRLHKRAVMMAAGNHTTDSAVAYDMSTALQSRLIHLDLKVSHKDWIEWALDEDIDYRVIAFIEFKPDMLHTFKPDHDDHTFACPRTWEFGSKLIHGKDKLDRTEYSALLAGTVSSGVAREFMFFCDVFENLPKIDDIVNDPKGTEVPTDMSIKYALATYLPQHINSNNGSAITQYIARLPVEIRVVCLRMINAKDSKLLRQIKEMNDLYLDLLRLM